MNRATSLRRVERRAVRRGLIDLLAATLSALDRQRERRALLRLDDRMLKDIGLTRTDAVREADKPFWRF